MGLLKLFTNPAGFAADFLKDKVTSSIKDRGGFLDSVMDKKDDVSSGFDKLQERIQSKTGIVSDKVDSFRDRALEGGDVRGALFDKLGSITDRDLPEVDEYKPAGKAAEWMNRLGAGLYAAGGGNPEDIYRNFRNKEMVKQERHQRQVELRQAALEKRDDDVLNILSSIDTRESTAAAAFAGDASREQTSLQMKGMDVTQNMLINEAEDARHLMDLQNDWEVMQQNHTNMMVRADQQGRLDEHQIQLAAEIQNRNVMNNNLTSMGLNAASFESTTEKYARGDFSSLTPAESTRLALYAKLQKARTDEEAMNVKMNAVTNLIGTRVHAQDSTTGEYLYGPGPEFAPIYTTLGNGEMAARHIFGGAQEAADAFNYGQNVDQERAALETMVSQGGRVQDPMKRRSMALDKVREGYPSTREDTFAGQKADPRDAKKQMAQAENIWSDAVGFMEQGEPFLSIVQALDRDGIHPEVMQMVITQAVNGEYWDGQENRDEINAIIMGIPQGRGD